MSIFTSKATATAQKSPYEFTVKDIDGKDVDLSRYKGKVVLVVNVASQCGEFSLLPPSRDGAF